MEEDWRLFYYDLLLLPHRSIELTKTYGGLSDRKSKQFVPRKNLFAFLLAVH